MVFLYVWWENRGNADSFSSFIALEVPNSKGFTINQAFSLPKVQKSLGF